MKIFNTDEENLHIFRATWEFSMKFSRKKCLMIILKVTKNRGLLSLVLKITKDLLNPFSTIVLFCTLRKHQKTFGFQGYKMGTLARIGLIR